MGANIAIDATPFESARGRKPRPSERRTWWFDFYAGEASGPQFRIFGRYAEAATKAADVGLHLGMTSATVGAY